MKKRLHWLLKIVFFCLVVEIAIRATSFLYLNKMYINTYGFLFSHSNPMAKSVNIVCLGESSTAGLWVNWEDSYPKQLERELRGFYHNDNINVIVPPHVGQNTSQVANRIRWYIALYKPKLIILMVGANNKWSFAESHIDRFLSLLERDTWRIKILLILDNVRIFKMVRYFYQKFIIAQRELSGRYLSFILGHPESVYPRTKIWSNTFERKNKKAFLDLWRYDVQKVIQEAKRNGIQVILMTYHINPTDYLSEQDFVSIADEKEVFLVRNDRSFESFIENGTINNFLLHDHWHLNNDGYEIIANNVFEAIKTNNILESSLFNKQDR